MDAAQISTKDRDYQLKAMARVYTCAECHGELVVPWSPQEGRLVLRCGQNKAHSGINRSMRRSGLGDRFGEEAVNIWDEIEKEVPWNRTRKNNSGRGWRLPK